MNERKQIKKQIEELFNDIQEEQVCLLRSIRNTISDTPYRKAELLELKRRINEEYYKQNWFM